MALLMTTNIEELQYNPLQAIQSAAGQESSHIIHDKDENNAIDPGSIMISTIP